MKILLVGEFSGFYNSLAEGLKILGHEVFLANNGDLYRGFYSDYSWNSKRYKGKIGLIHGLLNLINDRDIFTGYDVVQLITPKFYNTSWLNKKVVSFLIKNNKKIFWTPAGESDLIFKFWSKSEGLRCGMYDFLLNNAKKNKVTPSFKNKRRVDYEKWFIDNINGIIPTMFEYAEPFRNHHNNLGSIPFPINIDKISYHDNLIKDKIIFYHGITRPIKGTKYICQAFNLMRKKYGNIAKFICNEKMPYDEYIKVMSSTNVILDQTNSFSSGMNGLISLAKGKIVLGGGDPIGFNELGYEQSPILNITSDVEQICSQIEFVINNRFNIHKMGRSGRLFIENNHDYKTIAKRYVEKWTKV